MLTNGLDHVATITNDADRLIAFYTEVFEATVEADGPEFPGGPRMVILNLGPATELNVFEIEGNTESFDEIRTRLMAAGASDGTVTDFGRKVSIFFRDPDEMACEVLFLNPDPPSAETMGQPHQRWS